MTSNNDVIIAPVETEEDLRQGFRCVSEAFGRQIKDAVWVLMFSGWDTEEGQIKHSDDMIQQWKSASKNKDGLPNVVFIKATVPNPDKPGERVVAGLSIWKQLSLVKGYGENFTGDMTEAIRTVKGEDNQRFAAQMFRSLWKRRIEYIKEVADSGRTPPAIFTLDMCAVDPRFQRRGIAGKLVEAGLAEARRRGDLECTTEGSVMGHPVYRKLGFKDEGNGEIVYEVDDEFKSWDKPPNVFLRTRA